MMRRSILANAYVQDLLKSGTVTDDAARTEYERIKATITGTEYKARHILVEKESEARDIIARLRKEPGAFAKLAMAIHSGLFYSFNLEDHVPKSHLLRGIDSCLDPRLALPTHQRHSPNPIHRSIANGRRASTRYKLVQNLDADRPSKGQQDHAVAIVHAVDHHHRQIRIANQQSTLCRCKLERK